MRLSIRNTAGVALAIGASSVMLAACGGGDSGGGGNTASMNAGSGIVSVNSVDNQKVLADSQGRTLYSADVEKGGRIMCTSGCTSFWTPVSASPGQAKAAATDLNLDLGVVSRPGGAEQLTFDGKPLYSFTEEGPGQLKGNGFVDDFHGTHFTWTAAGGGQTASGSGSGSTSSPY
jgi:predicted lipoprotein with Yx(FWY)xxD motif